MAKNFLFPLSLFALLSLSLAGCGSPARLAFEVKGISASEDGSFTNNTGFRVIPERIQLVVGDWHLKLQNPDKELSETTNLSPLLKPGEQIAPGDIGKDGKFPGLWVANLMPKAKPTLFPTGNVEMQQYQQISWRLAPAVTGVRGLSTQDPVYQHTLAMSGQVQKDTISCRFQLSIAFEKGLTARISFSPSDPALTRYTIGVAYENWLEDIDFTKICSGDNKEVVVTNQSHPEVVVAVKKNIASSFRFQFDSLP